MTSNGWADPLSDEPSASPALHTWDRGVAFLVRVYTGQPHLFSFPKYFSSPSRSLHFNCQPQKSSTALSLLKDHNSFLSRVPLSRRDLWKSVADRSTLFSKPFSASPCCEKEALAPGSAGRDRSILPPSTVPASFQISLWLIQWGDGVQTFFLSQDFLPVGHAFEKCPAAVPLPG